MGLLEKRLLILVSHLERSGHVTSVLLGRRKCTVKMIYIHVRYLTSSVIEQNSLVWCDTQELLCGIKQVSPI
jgi:hypothetical protein